MIAAVHIVKGRSWHGRQEEFENVYHYDTPVISTEDGWRALVDRIVNSERTIHAPDVQFLRARVNGPTDGTKEANIMQYVGDLTGTGAMDVQFLAAPELAYVCSFYVGRSPKGYKVFLRKHFHSAAVTGINRTEGMALGTQTLGAPQKAPFITHMNEMKTLVVGGGTSDLCTPSGRKLPVGSDPKVLDYLYTRQFRRGTRRKRLVPA